MDGLFINGVKATGYTNNVSNVRKTDSSTPMFATKATDDDGFYPGLKLSPESRIENFLTNDPKMKILNDMFGI